jgi:hypothetical protein
MPLLVLFILAVASVLAAFSFDGLLLVGEDNELIRNFYNEYLAWLEGKLEYEEYYLRNHVISEAMSIPNVDPSLDSSSVNVLSHNAYYVSYRT